MQLIYDIISPESIGPVSDRQSGRESRKEEGGQMEKMTQGQFKAYIRLIIDALKEVLEMETEEKKAEKLGKIIENLQSSLED